MKENIGARGIANVAYGVARSGIGKSFEVGSTDQKGTQLLTALAKAAERRIWVFNTQDLANTAWAFATAGFPKAELFSVLAKAVKRSIGDFKEQGLANTA